MYDFKTVLWLVNAPVSVDEPIVDDDPAHSNQLDDVPSPMYDQLLIREHTAEVGHPSPSPGSQLGEQRDNQQSTPESTESAVAAQVREMWCGR